VLGVRSGEHIGVLGVRSGEHTLTHIGV
jgi:hypothetical protein